LRTVLTQFRSSKTYERVTRHLVVHQFVKYAMVGVLNVCVHVGIFNLLAFAGLATLAANAIAFFFASINSFFWNKRWAFRDERREAVVRQYFVFLSFTLVGLGLHTGTFSLLLIPLHQHGTLGKNAALLLALPVSVIWNFTCYKLWTFSPPPSATEPSAGLGSASA
jgi:putative flippase GtrA